MAKAKITAQWKPLAVPLDSLTPDPKNPRQHTARNLEAIAGSLKKFGQRKPIVVQKEGMIVRAGNGTLAAARSLGWTELAAVIITEDNEKAEQFSVVDNRTSELADWDHGNLVDLLQGWDDMDIPGFSDAELEGIAGSLDVDLGIVGGAVTSTLDVTGGTGTIGGYEPKVHPIEGEGGTTEADLAKAEARIAGIAEGGQSSIPIVCPSCAHEFRIQG